MVFYVVIIVFTILFLLLVVWFPRKSVYSRFLNKEIPIEAPTYKIESGTKEIPHLRKATFTPEYTQKIPLNVIQTEFSRQVSNRMSIALERNFQINPEYDHYFFSDEECKAFISKHFPREVLDAYNTLKPGAYKADLFRVCALYIMGGVYYDSGMTMSIPFRELFHSNNELIVMEDANVHLKDYGLFNGFIACTPGDEVMLATIQMILNNVRKKVYPKSFFGITGPVLFLKAFSSIHKGKSYFPRSKKEDPIRVWKHCYRIVSLREVITKNDEDVIFACKKFIGYKKLQKKFSKPAYFIYFRNRQVYGEKGRINHSLYEGKDSTFVEDEGEYQIFDNYTCSYVPMKNILEKYPPKIKKEGEEVKSIEHVIEDTDSDRGIVYREIYLNPEFEHTVTTTSSTIKEREVPHFNPLRMIEVEAA